MEYKKLTPEEARIILNRGTEPPFSGEYNKHYGDGIYSCKQCGTKLFNSESKFDSRSGWPSFDEAIKGAVKEISDLDGMRTEIVCANCGAHLGHVFRGENMTAKNTRHCVNSISLEFDKDESSMAVERAYFAGGCFWGVEHLMQSQDGVLDVVSGYMGGESKNPTYREVSYSNTGHLEVVEVSYYPSKVNYETLARLFFEIHDPTQKNGQGPDIGEQYLSAIFVNSSSERKIVEKLIGILESKGYKVATTIRDMAPFYRAEEYHQDYYKKSGKVPYCHSYKKIF